MPQNLTLCGVDNRIEYSSNRLKDKIFQNWSYRQVFWRIGIGYEQFSRPHPERKLAGMALMTAVANSDGASSLYNRYLPTVSTLSSKFKHMNPVISLLLKILNDCRRDKHIYGHLLTVSVTIITLIITLINPSILLLKCEVVANNFKL